MYPSQRHLLMQTFREATRRPFGYLLLMKSRTGPAVSSSTRTTATARCIHWVAFHFPREGPVEFFDSLGRSPEYYLRRFRNVLIATGPQYRFSTTQVQPGSSDTCGLYCVHFVKMRYRNISMEDIVKDFSSRDLMSNDDKLLALYE
ncbi:Hypothetical predicted protein [Mytilus galloprovincialis]|uniref:Ubiquitin-like protease family profile domain-containing protein n=1 Tax=Mytilus galloprovincialis TaxID=29158 RepID=A0A8B6C4G8_MYTGA|nr:Hypothetical predicted protein [Mytilus galloprovincialis]